MEKAAVEEDTEKNENKSGSNILPSRTSSFLFCKTVLKSERIAQERFTYRLGPSHLYLNLQVNQQNRHPTSF